MMTPSRLERGSTANAVADFRRRPSPLPQTADCAEAGKDGKVVEKEGANGAQTARAFQAPKPPQQAKSLCHLLPPAAPKVAR
jgi:hypothetical protein